MATNPNNAVGTNGAYPGRTSVNAFNDCLGVYAGRGVLSGFHVSANSGMSVSIGGNGLVRDVAIAEDNLGNRTTINNISRAPITVNIPAAPASGSRYDSLVAYVVNPPQGGATVIDNPGACGLIVVSGSTGGAPVLATDAEIRNAITLDSGASGDTAYYVVLGEVLVASGTTSITAAMITQETQAILSGSKVIDGTLNGSAIADGSIHGDKIEDLGLPWSKMDSEVLWTGNTASTVRGWWNLSKSIERFRWVLVRYGLTNWVGIQNVATFEVKHPFSGDHNLVLSMPCSGGTGTGSWAQIRMGILLFRGGTQVVWVESGAHVIGFNSTGTSGVKEPTGDNTISVYSIIGVA